MKIEESGVLKFRTNSLLSMAAKVALKEGKNILQNHGEKRLLKMMEQADIIVRHVEQNFSTSKEIRSSRRLNTI